jgi:Flp pilus assembly pilin Flp
LVKKLINFKSERAGKEVIGKNLNKKLKIKEVMRIKVIRIKEKIKSLCERKGQSTLEYALVMVIAGIISAILVAVGKPMIIDIISKVFSKISQMV